MQQDGLTGSADGQVGRQGLSRWRERAGWLERRVCAPGDDDEARLRKVVFALGAILIVPAGLVWSGLYVAYGEGVAALLPFAYSVLTLADLGVLFRFRRFAWFEWSQQVLIFVLPIALQVALGGFVGSSAVIVWAFLAVLMAVMFGSAREAWWWFGAFVTAVVLATAFQPHLQVTNDLPAWLITAFFALNIAAVSSVAFAVLHSFTRDRQRLRELEVSYLNQELMLRQSEKLATLGTLAAGVAHELNNPAAAAVRGVAQLRPLIDGMQTAYLKTYSALSPGEAPSVGRIGEVMRSRAGRVVSLSPLERSDRRDEIAGWLAGLGVEDPAEAAGALVDLGYTRADLGDLTASVAPASVSSFLSWTARAGAADKLLAEVGEGARRISEIVHAMRSYAYLDQAPVQDLDVTEGLEDTLVLLNSKLKDGVLVHREYEEGLPHIEAYGSELNQVWTNIIENAIDAMGGTGNLTLRASRRNGHVSVEVEDDGPGMPPQVAARVFDPFFTTKPPGKGTGLGLNISHNIVVQKHRGRIEVDSEPGRTTFRVSLPIGSGG